VNATDYRHRYPAEILGPGARAPSFDLPVTPDRQWELCEFRGPQPGDGVLSGRLEPGVRLTGRRLTLSRIGNVLCFIFAGWWLALVHLFTGIALCLTIIGAAPIPLGKEIVALPEGTYAGMIVFDAARRLH
jgi:hypothetical protein